MSNSLYDYSSTQVNAPDHIARRIMTWCNDNIPDEDIYEAPRFGREDEIHVTALYGIHTESPKQIQSVLKRQEPIYVELGQISLFDTNPDYDVVYIEVISPELHDINRKLRENIRYTNRFPKYTPHMTVAYVLKGKGDKFLEDTKFEGVSFIADTILFCSRDGEKHPIALD